MKRKRILSMLLSIIEKMKNKNSKIPYFLFWSFLFFLVGFSSVKPFISHLIGETYIGPELCNQIYGTIMTTSSSFEYDKALELEKMIQSHPQLCPLIHRYICAYADIINGDERAVETMNNDKAFDIMNQDILEWIEVRNMGNSLTVNDEEFLALLRENENVVEEMFIDGISEAFLWNMQFKPAAANKMIIMIELYRVVTSWWIQILLFLFMILSISPFFTVYSEKFFNNISQIFIIQGCFWSSIYILHRISGQGMYSVTISFIWRGIVLIMIGILVLITKVYIFHKKKKKVYIPNVSET